MWAMSPRHLERQLSDALHGRAQLEQATKHELEQSLMSFAGDESYARDAIAALLSVLQSHKKLVRAYILATESRNPGHGA
jgi:hypothetical protein